MYLLTVYNKLVIMCISVTILCVFVDCFSLFIREGGSHSLFRNGTDFYGFYGFWPFSGV